METWTRTYRDAGTCGPEHGWVARSNKPLVEHGVCAEIAVRDELAARPGWDAVWVRKAVGLGAIRFWRTMPADMSDPSSGELELPSWPTAVLDRITPTWRRGGVLDVFAWNEETQEVLFAGRSDAARIGYD
jgi:hypothetical protein